jgi:predicted CDP-diglyceride synthetase/phosphatidate cytidylyltransferase
MPSFALADWTSFALFFFALSVVCSGYWGVLVVSAVRRAWRVLLYGSNCSGREGACVGRRTERPR